MSPFVESCVETAAGSATRVVKRSRGRLRARKLLRLLQGKHNILITTHVHPDPDALSSAAALHALLRVKLPQAKLTIAVKGHMASGINAAFVRYSDLRPSEWDESKLPEYDAILLLDTQPDFPYNPLPASVLPTAVIDHHRSAGRLPTCSFCDVRTDVGATGSIIFSYFMELEVSPKPDLAATLLYGIESDLAGAAGTPGELDNLALSSLTLLADPRKLYQMRYVALPQNYYAAYAAGLGNAVFYDNVLISHLDSIDSLEKTGVIADFLLRFDKVNWCMVTAVHEGKLLASIRTSNGRMNAAEIARRLFRQIGQGGGHRAKAGGLVKLESGSITEIERVRTLLRKRILRALKISSLTRGQRLVPKAETSPSTSVPHPPVVAPPTP